MKAGQANFQHNIVQQCTCPQFIQSMLVDATAREAVYVYSSDEQVEVSVPVV